jgi:uncharacterized protein (TIGR02246 family)
MKIIKTALVLVLVPCLGLIACTAEQAGEEAAQTMEMAMTVDLEAVAEAFATARAEYKRAYEAGDAAALAALYTADAIQLPPDAEVMRGRAAIEEDFAAGFAETTSREVTIAATDMGASGNLAYEIGTYSMTYHVEGVADPVMDEGEYLVVSKLAEDGTWKVLAHMWSSSLPETQ